MDDTKKIFDYLHDINIPRDDPVISALELIMSKNGPGVLGNPIEDYYRRAAR